MNVSRPIRKAVAVAGLVCFAFQASGCGADSNEKDFLNSAPAGKPSEFPDEKVSDRRSRLMGKEVTKKGRTKPAAAAK